MARTTLRMTLTLSAIASVTLAAVASSPASAMPGPARAALVPIGAPPSLAHGATGGGPLPADTILHVTVTLEPRDPAALATYARQVATVGSSVYRQYLTPKQFARRFGARATEVRAVERSLRARGLNPGPVSAGSLSISVTATAARFERGLALLAHGASGGVQSIVGLDTAAAPRPLLVHAPSALRGPSRGTLPSLRTALARAHIATGGPQPCAAAQSAASAQGSHTADQIASAYGFSSLYGAGDQGAGTTVAVYELEQVDPGDIAAYQACYGTHTSVSYVPVDGGVGAGAGSGEGALDIENLLGLAPAAKVLVYQGPNSDSGAPGAGPYDTFSAIINQDRAQVVSVSWGECEAALGAANAAAENTLFAQAAVQGQTIVAAAGDSGSEDCDTGADPLQSQLAVDDPSSQPLVIGVGGTTLRSPGSPPSESVWNDGGTILGGPRQPGAGGGGISSLWQMPAGQLDASPALDVLGAGATGSQCGHPGGYCREVPDVSADADPATGYEIYYNGSGGQAGERGWQMIGGTSAAAPLWAALMALADASHGCAHSAIGYAVPTLYRAAGESYGADFNDVRSGENDFTQSNGGRFAAGAGYDEASGLGTPNAAALATGLCADALRLISPGTQRSAERATVSLRLRASDSRGAAVQLRATGLPPGLTLHVATGQITGEARRTGTYAVAVTAHDAQGSTASESFSWSVGAAPRILAAALTGLSANRPTLSFTVAAGRGSPALRELVVTLGGNLRLTSARNVRIAASGAARPHFTATAAGGVLRIELDRAFHTLWLTLAYPALRAASGRHPQARGPKAPELAVSVLDAGHGSSRLSARIGSDG
ncbi:MAG: protease pro-enzyme activation domain-containing protein [Solirubrobacteraceae bacterium]